jgi:hypothetical protein
LLLYQWLPVQALVPSVQVMHAFRTDACAWPTGSSAILTGLKHHDAARAQARLQELAQGIALSRARE